MEISTTLLEAATLLIGGGGLGYLITLKSIKRKGAAEAKRAEAEAEKSSIEAKKEEQDYYQQLAKDLAEDREDRKRQNVELREERDHYKNERNEYRNLVDNLNKEIQELKRTIVEKDLINERRYAQLANKVDGMRPLLCGDLACARRRRVNVSDDGDIEAPKKTTKKK